jgi:hypothetical protein
LPEAEASSPMVELLLAGVEMLQSFPVTVPALVDALPSEI